MCVCVCARVCVHACAVCNVRTRENPFISQPKHSGALNELVAPFHFLTAKINKQDRTPFQPNFIFLLLYFDFISYHLIFISMQKSTSNLKSESFERIWSSLSGSVKTDMFINGLRCERWGFQRWNRHWYFIRFGEIGRYIIKQLNLLISQNLRKKNF